MGRKPQFLEEKIKVLENHLELCQRYRDVQVGVEHGNLFEVQEEVFNVLRDAKFFRGSTTHMTVSISPIIAEMAKRKMIEAFRGQ